jgi:hypothetical protein
MGKTNLITTAVMAAMAGCLIIQFNQLVAQAEQLAANNYQLKAQSEELRARTERLQLRTEQLTADNSSTPRELQLAAQPELPEFVVSARR